MARVRVEVPVETETVEQQSNVHQNVHTNSGLTVKKAAIIVFAIIGIIFVGKLVADKNKLEQQVKSSQTTTSDVSQLVEQLSKSVELPENETPQIRTIDDASKFTEQNPSLADIKNGDQLLFFEKTQKVVVYRPSTKKAVVVVTLSQPTSQQNVTQ